MAADLLPLGVPALWLLDAGIGWVGLVRHAYRAYRARVERDGIIAAGDNGLLKFAADGMLVGERVRLALKVGLTAFALLRLNVQWERLDTLAPDWDWRDVVQPLVYLMVLLLLTGWSNWEQERRPQKDGG